MTSETEAPEYFGQGLSWEDYDALMAAIKPAWVEEERSLFDCKWFDYRQMHPTDATYLYAHKFESAYRHAYANNFDRSAADHVRVFEDIDVFTIKKQRIGGLWRGRMVADMMGMPYEVFLPLAFEHRLRRWQRPYMPQPSHLYDFGFAIESIDAKWVERQSASLITAQGDYYKNESYRGLKAQNDHHEWLFDLATKRENAAPVLARFFREQLLPLEKIGTRMGSDMIERVLSYT